MIRLTTVLAAALVAASMMSPKRAGGFGPEDVLKKTPTEIPLPPEPAPAPLPSARQIPAPPLGAPGPYAPVPMAAPGEEIDTAPLPMVMAPVFHRVEYKDLDNIHPHGIPALVQVPDPCGCDCGHCRACHVPQLVSIMIYVPPGPCSRVKVRHGGRRIEFDCGKYEVEIKVRDGYVKVDYDD